MGDPQFFLGRTFVALKDQKEVKGAGSSLLKGKTFHQPYFGAMFERGTGFFVNDRKGYPKNMNAMRLGSGNSLHQ